MNVPPAFPSDNTGNQNMNELPRPRSPLILQEKNFTRKCNLSAIPNDNPTGTLKMEEFNPHYQIDLDDDEDPRNALAQNNANVVDDLHCSKNCSNTQPSNTDATNEDADEIYHHPQNDEAKVNATNLSNTSKNTTSSKLKGSKTQSSTTNFGRRGDPRMNRAVATRLSNPGIPLLDALLIGGFSFPDGTNKSDRYVYDSDGVALCQRKNQLIRRLRLIRKGEKRDANKPSDIWRFQQAARGVSSQGLLDLPLNQSQQYFNPHAAMTDDIYHHTRAALIESISISERKKLLQELELQRLYSLAKGASPASALLSRSLPIGLPSHGLGDQMALTPHRQQARNLQLISSLTPHIRNPFVPSTSLSDATAMQLASLNSSRALAQKNRINSALLSKTPEAAALASILRSSKYYLLDKKHND